MTTAPGLSRWLPPLVCAAVFVLLAPFVGVLVERLRETFGLGYLPWLAAALGLAGALAVALALLRIRGHRPLRYGLLVLAASMVALQVLGWGTGAAQVDLVERVHLVEFGLLGALFERAFRPRHRNALLPVLVLAAVGLAAIADEWVQWLTPVRVGDVRDVLLNLWAGGIGYLLAVAVSAERGRLRRPEPRTRRLAAGLTALFVLAAAAFFDTAHLGHEIRDPRAGTFRSWHTPEELARAAEDRDRRWSAGGPLAMRPLSREDVFLTEGGFHVAARNRAVESGYVVRAWRENRILERWYAPLLDHRPGTRWPAVQRANTEAAVRERFRRRPAAVESSPGYRSPALAERIAIAPPRALFWLGVLLVGGIPGAFAAAPGIRWLATAPDSKRSRRRPHSGLEDQGSSRR